MGDADIVVAMAAHDVRVIFSPAEQVQSPNGAGTRENSRRRIDTAALRATYSPGEVRLWADHEHLLFKHRLGAPFFCFLPETFCQTRDTLAKKIIC
jgi:hypothetical protein